MKNQTKLSEILKLNDEIKQLHKIMNDPYNKGFSAVNFKRFSQITNNEDGIKLFKSSMSKLLELVKSQKVTITNIKVSLSDYGNLERANKELTSAISQLSRYDYSSHALPSSNSFTCCNSDELEDMYKKFKFEADTLEGEFIKLMTELHTKKEEELDQILDEEKIIESTLIVGTYEQVLKHFNLRKISDNIFMLKYKVCELIVEILPQDELKIIIKNINNNITDELKFNSNCDISYEGIYELLDLFTNHATTLIELKASLKYSRTRLPRLIFSTLNKY